MDQMARVMARLLVVTQQLEARTQALEHRAAQATQVLERSGTIASQQRGGAYGRTRYAQTL